MNSLRTVNPNATQTIANLNRFADDITAGKSVVCDRSGTWYCENWFKRLIIRILFALDNPRLMNVGRVFNACLDEHERYNTDMKAHRELHEAFLKAGNALLLRLSKCDTEESRFLVGHLTWRLNALDTRMKLISEREGVAASKGECIAAASSRVPALNHTIYRIQALAQQWKTQAFAWKSHATFTVGERIQLVNLSHYGLAQVILEEAEAKRKNPANMTPIQDHCFELILENRFPAKICALFPGMTQELSRTTSMGSSVAKRFGYFSESLQVDAIGSDITVQMRIMIRSQAESKEEAGKRASTWISINNPSKQIRLSSGKVYTVAEIISSLANKDFRWGNLEVLGTGDRNTGAVDEWHNGAMGTIGADGKPLPIALMGNWWENLPLLKWFSLEQMQEKYPLLNLDGGNNWIRVAMANRTEEDFVAGGTHAYLVVYVPHNKGYLILPFGFYPKEQHFPQTLPAMARFPFISVAGEVVFPDPSIYAHERQRGGEAREMTPTVAAAFMDVLKEKILRGRGIGGKLSYGMLSGANCATFVEKLCAKAGVRIPPGMYDAPFEASQPPGRFCFALLNKLPKKIRNPIFRCISKVAGGNATATRVFMRNGQEITRDVSVNRHQPWNEGRRLHIPAAAFVGPHPVLIDDPNGP